MRIITLFFSALMALILLSAPSYADEKGTGGCTSNIKGIMQALELWSNSHQGHFPTKEEFGGAKFAEYVKKATGQDPRKVIKCPVSGKPYLYTFSDAGKSYEIKCPAPEAHHLGALYYSREKGLVKLEVPSLPVPAASPAPGHPKKPAPPVIPPKSGKKPSKEITKNSPTAKTSVTPTPAPSPEAAASPSPSATPGEEGSLRPLKPAGKIEKPSEELAAEDREQITTVIKDLYDAYAERNLARILELQHEAIESSAIDYQKKKKGTADEVREAFKSATKEIIEHKDFKLLPLNLSDLTFSQKGKYCKVTSIVPIIATERLEVMEEGKYFFVRIRVGELIFEKKSDAWKIVNLYLY